MNEEMKVKLEALVAEGLTLIHCLDLFSGKMGEAEKTYCDYARDHMTSDGKVEVDSNSIASVGSDSGGYVLAWIWVPAEDAGLCTLCNEEVEDEDDRKSDESICDKCHDEAKAEA